MGRLRGVLLLSPDPERQKAFYEEKLGVAVATSAGASIAFATRGATLAIEARPAGEPAELRLRITASPIAARLAALAARGVTPEAGGPVVRDPEGNRVELVEAADAAPGANGPALSHAIVAARDFSAMVHFYRDALGLKVADEDEQWIEFDTGECRLKIHDRADDSVTLHEDQRITFALEDAEFEKWVDELRERGIKFAAAPMEDDELGLSAEVEDADGWFVVLHGPAPETPFEESFADEFDDDESGPHTEMIRRPGEATGEPAKKRTTPAKQARRAAERAGQKSVEAATREAQAPDRGGFTPRPFSSGPRPGGSSRPPGPPRPGGAPRSGGPSRPDGSSRPAGPRPFPPRPGGPNRSGSGER